MVQLSWDHMSFSTLLFSQPKAAGTLDVTDETPALVDLEITDGKVMHFKSRSIVESLLSYEILPLAQGPQHSPAHC
jgi:hypothetical protein